MLKMGMVSKWHVHAEGYANDIAQSGLAEIAAVWDENPVRGAAWAQQIGTSFFEDYDAFLEQVDGICCTSPTTLHPDLLKKAALAKKHIFTEKLLAINTDTCRELCKLIESAGKTFTIALPCKCDSTVQYVKNLTQSGKLGTITGARFRRSHSGVSNRWLPDDWFNIEFSGGGAMMDLGAHPVYILADLFGFPKTVSCLMSNIYGTSNMRSDENAIAVMRFEHGILATAETAFVTDYVPDLLEVYGTEGAVYMRGGEVTQSLKCEGGKPRMLSLDELPAQKPSPLLQFLARANDGLPGAPDGLDLQSALMMTQIIELAYLSNGGVYQ
ncbi:MAG: Gfo/Idh/MocA family oxidoreductase [Oscillospiraceae bacterium]|jgi:predicted dehydrogenase|nr:Gfo/Idh/MocA family oxidoreductase [Oscillospiraceae bacterium]